MKVKLIKEAKLSVVGVPVVLAAWWAGINLLEFAVRADELWQSMLAVYGGGISIAGAVVGAVVLPVMVGRMLWRRYDVQAVRRFQKWVTSDDM